MKENLNRPDIIGNLGPVQTWNFTCAESNAGEENLLFLLITIRFGTCEVRRLKQTVSFRLLKSETRKISIAYYFSMNICSRFKVRTIQCNEF